MQTGSVSGSQVTGGRSRNVTPWVTSTKTLLTVKEIAKELAVTTHAVYRWIDEGKLPAIQLGGPAGFRIRPEDLNQFLENRKVGAA